MNVNLSDVDALLDRYRDRFRRLLQRIAAEEEGEDPFRFPLDRFLQLDESSKVALIQRAGLIAQERVERELRDRSAAWIVILGDRVVLDSLVSPSIPSPDAVLTLGERDNLVPYLFEAPLIEELAASSRWSPLGAADSYPNVPVAVGSATLTEIVADLDTGSHATLVDDRVIGTRPSTWFVGRHLGDPFVWAPSSARVALRTRDGQRLERDFPLRVVRDWENSPFVRINAARQMLVGRDFLRAFALSVVLKSAEAETELLAGG